MSGTQLSSHHTDPAAPTVGVCFVSRLAPLVALRRFDYLPRHGASSLRRFGACSPMKWALARCQTRQRLVKTPRSAFPTPEGRFLSWSGPQPPALSSLSRPATHPTGVLLLLPLAIASNRSRSSSGAAAPGVIRASCARGPRPRSGSLQALSPFKRHCPPERAGLSLIPGDGTPRETFLEGVRVWTQEILHLVASERPERTPRPF
jgi:hypothetical protein